MHAHVVIGPTDRPCVQWMATPDKQALRLRFRRMLSVKVAPRTKAFHEWAESAALAWPASLANLVNCRATSGKRHFPLISVLPKQKPKCLSCYFFGKNFFWPNHICLSSSWPFQPCITVNILATNENRQLMHQLNKKRK